MTQIPNVERSISTAATRVTMIIAIVSCMSLFVYWLVNRQPSRPLYDSLKNHQRLSAEVMQLGLLLDQYRTANRHYPTTKQGLQAAIKHHETIPKDPWGNDYIYRCPGKIRQEAYDLFSAGADRVAYTADDDWGDSR